MRLHSRHIVLVGFTALALAGCKKQGVDVDHASMQQVASAVGGAAPAFQPGRWESTMKMEKMDIPGMPPEARAMMAKSPAMARTISTCLTPERAAKPGGDFFNQNNANCVYDHFSMGGGKLDATMTCNGKTGKLTMTMNGTFSPDQYEVHTSSQEQMPGGQAMNVGMTVTSHRVGECTGNETAIAR